jgi:hypothetical protein
VNVDFYQAWINRKWNGADHVLYSYSINWIVRVFVVLIPCSCSGI